ncbi:acyl-homoserine-lactone synthase [Fundidesulfovibrio terrae]|uniref:acyl-homoserine-lactone synthase n=1 Tax=Fundidesulfovibrio terrae TaxID=2922866 RepID=UPI001FAE8F5D|nr:acyl-homoserine-lactone synthase [Fundidesulfovibrio terrae]
MSSALVFERREYEGVWISEDQFSARSIDDDEEMLKGYRLRHEVFAESLRWVPVRNDGLECDAYDDDAVHFGVFEGPRLLAYLRVIKPGRRFMVESDFRSMVGPHYTIRKDSRTGEMSRLCLSPYAKQLMRAENFGYNSIQMMLHKCVYHWCNANDIRYLYLAVEKKVYRMMRICGFVCRPIGDPVVMPDGVEAVAAILDLREFDELNSRKNPKMYQWFSQFQSIHNVLPVQQPGIGLRH